MACYDEFPLSTVIYNWSSLGGLSALGVVISAQFGAAFLLGYALLLPLALAGTVATICRRCGGYYGRRCGLGLGAIVPVFFRRGRPELFLRTPMQVVSLVLLLAVVALPIAGASVLLAQDLSPRRLTQLVVAVALLLAFAVPHPRLVCRHCHQGARGDCPVGQRMG